MNDGGKLCLHILYSIDSSEAWTARVNRPDCGSAVNEPFIRLTMVLEKQTYRAILGAGLDECRPLRLDKHSMPRRELSRPQQIVDWLEEWGAALDEPASMTLIGSAALLWHAADRGLDVPLPENRAWMSIR